VLAGADHDTVAAPSPATADTPVGAPGTPERGVIWADAVDAELVWLFAFVAVTVNVYATPFVSPVNVFDATALPVDCVAPPGVAVTV
jgi:hypothetical protein